MKANKKGESVPHKGRIKSHNIEHDTYSIIFDDGRVDNKVRAICCIVGLLFAIIRLTLS